MVKRIYIDTGLLGELCTDTKEIYYENFLDISIQLDLELENRRVNFPSDWSLFLEFIGLGRILKNTSANFDESVKESIIHYFNSSIPLQNEQLNEIIENAYKNCLSDCQHIKEIDASNLQMMLNKKRELCLGKISSFIIPFAIGQCEERIKSHPENAYFQICYNLSWELLTMRLLSLISQTKIKKHHRVLELFQPLISIWHRISSDFGSRPSLFRLMEASYLATIDKQPNMTKETILKLTTYRQKYQTRPKGDLADCSYIDFGMMGHVIQSHGEIFQYPITVFTCDKPTQVVQRLNLFRYMLEKLYDEVEGWNIFPQYASTVICLQIWEGRLKFVDSVSHPILIF